MATKIDSLNVKLTELQETILCELNATTDQQIICKKMHLKPVTLSKTLSLLSNKNLLNENKLTEQGKKMVNYIIFRNTTILDFLNKNNINTSNEIIKQMKSLDLKIIIALKNALV